MDSNCAEDLLISVNDHNRRFYDFIIESSSIYDTQGLLKELAKNKLLLPPWIGIELSIHIHYWYTECLKKGAIEYKHSKLGWLDYNGQEFFLYKETDINGIKSCCARKNIDFCNGSEETYKQFLKETVYPIPTLSLAMAIGYSAVVASRLKDMTGTGTIIVNLCGASSTGKTTVEQLLVSPFANPKISNKGGLVRTFMSTANARFAGLEGINGLPMVLDDATTASYLDTSNLIYSIASGEEKSRCDSNGKLRDDSSGWSGLVVISSETPIQDDSKQNQGLQVRVLHTQGITWTPNAETAEYIKRIVTQNYGFTGIEFAEYVKTIPLNALFKRYEKSKEEVNSLMVLRDNLTDRLSSKYAIILLTIKLMNEHFCLTLNEQELIRILLTPEQKGVEERDISVKALNAIVAFIQEKRSNFEIDSFDRSGNQSFPKGNNYGTIVISKNGSWYVYIPTNKTDEILKNNGIFETKTVRKRWAEKQITKCDADHNSVKKTIDKVSRRCDCFIFHKGIASDFANDINELSGDTKPEEDINLEPQVSNYYVDDEEEINKIFNIQGENNEKK